MEKIVSKAAREFAKVTARLPTENSSCDALAPRW